MHTQHLQRAGGNGAEQTFLLRQNANHSHHAQQNNFLHSSFAWLDSRHCKLTAAPLLDTRQADNHLLHHQDDAPPHHHNARMSNLIWMKKTQNSLHNPPPNNTSITTYQQAAFCHRITSLHRCLSKDFGGQQSPSPFVNYEMQKNHVRSAMRSRLPTSLLRP